MALRLKDKDILILAKGDVKLDNKKFKACFGSKARFIKSDEVEAVTGHPLVAYVLLVWLKRWRSI